MFNELSDVGLHKQWEIEKKEMKVISEFTKKITKMLNNNQRRYAGENCLDGTRYWHFNSDEERFFYGKHFSYDSKDKQEKLKLCIEYIKDIESVVMIMQNKIRNLYDDLDNGRLNFLNKEPDIGIVDLLLQRTLCGTWEINYREPSRVQSYELFKFENSMIEGWREWMKSNGISNEFSENESQYPVSYADKKFCCELETRPFYLEHAVKVTANGRLQNVTRYYTTPLMYEIQYNMDIEILPEYEFENSTSEYESSDDEYYGPDGVYHRIN